MIHYQRSLVQSFFIIDVMRKYTKKVYDTFNN